MDVQELDETVARLRRHGRDTDAVEVKAAVGKLPKSLASTISAFSNTRGGVLILGLEEETGFHPAPGFNAIAIADGLKELVRPRKAGELQPSLSPDPIVEVSILEFEGAEVVVATVEELPPEMKPCFVVERGKEQGSFERLLDGDHRMSTYAIFLLSSNRSQPIRDVDVVPGVSLTDLDEALLQGLVTRVRSTRARLAAVSANDEDLLKKLRVLDPETGGVTLAGYLSLGRYPQERFPQFMISYAHFPASSLDGARGEIRMLDRGTYDGPIPWMISDALRKIEATLPKRRVSLGRSSTDVPEIPIDVVREAIVNSLAHRDYSAFAESEQVKIELYPDRLDISNPGGIWGGRRESELLDGTSRSRNSWLTRLLPDVPLPDNSTVSENQGTGIRFMVGSMKSQGLPLPTFTATNVRFTTSLARHGLMDPDVVEHLALVGAANLDERSLAALALALQKGRLDDQVVRYQLDMDSYDAWRLLLSLNRGGWLEQDRRGDFIPSSKLSATPLPFLELQVTDSEQLILGVLESRKQLGIRDLAAATNLSIGVLRRDLRRLIEANKVVATAPPTSRLREYRLSS